VSDDRIRHVVVLMLENRSFDHMLGYLDQKCLPPLSTSDAVPEDPAQHASPLVHVKWIQSYADVTADPGHGYDDVMRQITRTRGPWSSPYTVTNNGFVWNYGTRKTLRKKPVADKSEIMGCYRAADVPVISTVAREFAVCSRWHCSLPSETWPNRLFAHAGTSFGEIAAEHILHRGKRTIFDVLSEEGLRWRVYAGDVAQVLTFGEKILHRTRHMSSFEHDVLNGELAAYSFIEPRHFDLPLGRKSNSQHPTSKFHGIKSTGYVPRGEELIASVYNALRKREDVWNQCLMIVVYDEHGGFYDRLPAPEVPPMEPSATNGFPFDLLGPRVPAVIISPYIRGGVVQDDRWFDHTSLTATIREIFGISSFLSERERTANTLTHLLDRATPRAADEVPSLDDYRSENVIDFEEDDEDRPARRLPATATGARARARSANASRT
jgi:phospholipase C